MTEIILHHYDASPFTQKALRMLGLKGLAWKSVETPMILPKPDLTALTGGYRGTPVMQIGSEVYVDTQRIAVELERQFPEPTLFPNHDAGLAYALVKWGEVFFRAGLHLAIGELSPHWDAAFLADRKRLFDTLDFDAVQADTDYSRSQLKAHAYLLNEQLADGRKFLGGEQPGLVDIQAFSVPWFTRASMPAVNDLLGDLVHLAAWEERVAALGEGERTPITAAEAHEAARRSAPDLDARVESTDAQGLEPDMVVQVEPDDARRGVVTGRVVAASANEIAVQHTNETVGTVVVHFPRMGYRVAPE